MNTDELDFQLPNECIATQPADPRDAAKLMVIRRASNEIEHCLVSDLAVRDDLLRPNDLLICNQSKVVPAYFQGIRCQTGGQISGLYLQSNQQVDEQTNTQTNTHTNKQTDTPIQWQVMLESRGKLLEGETIELTSKAHLKLLTRLGGGAWWCQLQSKIPTLSLLDEIGSTPLPPYIRHARKNLGQAEINPNDQARYNTVYARTPGSVAAPTAGLHFTKSLLAQLQSHHIELEHVLLHVGLGTFAPVRVQNLHDHPIHTEAIEVPYQTIQAIAATRKNGGRIIPIGTTSVRALESLPTEIPDHDYASSTQLFITPTPENWPFRFTDCLMTNFHLPRSTLLALVGALPNVGMNRLKSWYQVAIENNYRFYSYGDAMLLLD